WRRVRKIALPGATLWDHVTAILRTRSPALRPVTCHRRAGSPRPSSRPERTLRAVHPNKRRPQLCRSSPPCHASVMSRYRRPRIEGGIFFFTVTLADRSGKLLVQHVERLRQAYRAVRTRLPFATDAICILPDHLHAIWTLPPGDAD